MRARAQAPKLETTQDRRRTEDSSDLGVLAQAMGARMGADLSGVRFHDDHESAQAADEMDARAFTEGQDIHFGTGELAPGSREGRRLIAHELVHTVQNRHAGAGAVAAKSRTSAPGDAAEVEADRVADALVDGAGPLAVREVPTGALLPKHRRATKHKKHDKHDKHDKQEGTKRQQTAGEPENKPIVAPGPSGITQTHTEWGKLLYPMKGNDFLLDIRDAKKIDRSTESLMDQMHMMEHDHRRVVQKVGPSLYPEENFDNHVSGLKAFDVGSEIDKNLTDEKAAGKAREMTSIALIQKNVETQLGQTKHMLRDAQLNLRKALLDADKTRQHDKVRELQKQIEKIDGWFEVAETIGMTALEIAMNPEEGIAKAIEPLIKCTVELGFKYANKKATEDLEHQKEAAEEEAHEDEVEANKIEEEIARGDIEEAETVLQQLESELRDAADTGDKRSRSAEKAYDKQTKGDFKFGDIRKHADKCESDAIDVDQPATEARDIVHRFIPAVLGDLAAADLGRGATVEVQEEYLTLTTMTLKAAQKQEAMEKMSKELRDIAKRERDKLTVLDEKLANSGENFDLRNE